MSCNNHHYKRYALGVSASYAMQADVRIAVSETTTKSSGAGSMEPRIGFAGSSLTTFLD